MSATDFQTIIDAVMAQINLFIPLAAGLIALLWGVPTAFKLIRKVAK